MSGAFTCRISVPWPGGGSASASGSGSAAVWRSAWVRANAAAGTPPARSAARHSRADLIRAGLGDDFQVYLMDADGQWLARHDMQPALGAVPTLKWIRGSTVFAQSLPPLAVMETFAGRGLKLKRGVRICSSTTLV